MRHQKCPGFTQAELGESCVDRRFTAGVSGGHGASDAADWKPLQRNTLRGFFTIVTSSPFLISVAPTQKPDFRSWRRSQSMNYSQGVNGESAG
jgi:hypothetical protein